MAKKPCITPQKRGLIHSDAIIDIRITSNVLTMWGDIISWEDAQDFTVWYFMTFKIILFVMVLSTIWLTIWAKKLKKVD